MCNEASPILPKNVIPPQKLTLTEIDNPCQVIYELFDFAHLPRIREHALRALLASLTALTTYGHNLKSLIKHVNIVIENIIDDIEHVLRFLLEKYFNHYYQVIVNILDDGRAGENWANLLE